MRYLQPLSAGDICLGEFKNFDLYVCRQDGGLPPTIVARYGPNPIDYQTFNPALTGLAALKDAPEQFQYAYAMASRLGFADHLWDDAHWSEK